MGTRSFKALAVLAALLGPAALGLAPASAQDAPVPTPEARAEAAGLAIVVAADQTLDEFQWIARPLVVFADSPSDPRYIQQMEYIGARAGDLATRDVVVITDTDPAARTPIREELRPRGFDIVLIGKDGFKYLRKPSPWDVREISRSIDKMPMRQQELRDLRGK
ncbi:MAG: DUF4174 domain-containing protein [Maritimibacter sp.]|nr:DUF4174 domain-containing protein [Maritimibacter sp.]